ncbi:SDR family oxidoreductase [Fusobacterium gastrosuis]|uniref:SDR family oxidoreductase n=1 Tax=Fusobacterium gastrosuis TaxID=1755100 RepID=UPI001F5030E2|nr:SDR family NAD(P)-dependent oxidoreductase [Fusobacterium gastrosuis]MDD7410543.1 SDR family NAD(P)-dependent oxidoreductase [Fusobacteriaceae bacterium]MDY5305914.1 SDR family NAD(P)-dependent oxidoreductase [Fusobacterium gastrosuis]MDY5713272.1 SDR family NAD(P)-dependent oxidoreductase [Fusobacterium gastrosuis]
MKIALVTGATSGIGYEIAQRLLEKKYKVYALGQDFSKVSEEIMRNENFIELKCDLSKLNELEKVLHSIKKVSFSLIVNSAGLGYFGLHEELDISKIKNMLAVNLQAPLIITQFFLRVLKANRGTIINISSITAQKESPLGAAYSATKAGLSHFGKSLFEEVRKYGVKVVNIHPDMTKTNFYRFTFFECAEDENSYIDVWNIGEILNFILEQNQSIVMTDITIRPQKHMIKKKG